MLLVIILISVHKVGAVRRPCTYQSLVSSVCTNSNNCKHHVDNTDHIILVKY
jgi:hypothetical protein